MGILDKLFGEFVDVIEWMDDSDDTMVYRFERYGNEIKYGAMLTVRESQTAVLVSEGRVADLYEPGLYQLETRNMPIHTTLESWPHGHLPSEDEGRMAFPARSRRRSIFSICAALPI